MDWTVSVGRRKTSIARVFMAPAKAGKGKMEINGRDIEEYFPVDILRIKATEPFAVCGLSIADYDIKVNLTGGGINGQAGALCHGFARNLDKINAEEYHGALKERSLLTRDSRMVERKKFGQPKARKKTQFSKR